MVENIFRVFQKVKDGKQTALGNLKYAHGFKKHVFHESASGYGPYMKNK